MKKRMLSLALALIMVLGIAPMAHAEDAYLWPSDSTNTSQGYGNGHNGQDITSTKGSNIYATKSGTVVAVYTGCANNNAASSSGKSCGSATGCDPSLNYYKMNGKTVCNYGYGNGLAIKHSDGSGYSTYSHMQSVSVTVGQTVAQGDVVGKMGSAGNSTGTHCHFELVSEGSMTEGGKYFRPTKWINNNKSAVTYIYGLGIEFLPAAQSTWADKEKVTETNAVVVAQIKKNNGVKVTEMGLDLYDASENLIKSYSQKVTTPDTSTSWPCYWDINKEIGVTLTKGTVYTYRFTGVFNGTKYESDLWTFKTVGPTSSEPTPPPTSTPTPEPPVTPSPEPPVTSEPDPTEPPSNGPVSQLPEKFSATREWSVLRFDDISTKAWYYENVKDVYRYDLMNGRGASEFAPDGTLTVAESITLAARIHARYYGKTIPSFDGGAWYDGYVSYALQNGIYAEAPYDIPATREVFARILVTALPVEELWDNGNAIDFADEDQIRYRSSVELLCQAGVINGSIRGDQTFFDPADTITRAQAAAIVTRMVIPDFRTHP